MSLLHFLSYILYDAHYLLKVISRLSVMSLKSWILKYDQIIKTDLCKNARTSLEHYETDSLDLYIFVLYFIWVWKAVSPQKRLCCLKPLEFFLKLCLVLSVDPVTWHDNLWYVVIKMSYFLRDECFLVFFLFTNCTFCFFWWARNQIHMF